MFVFLSFLLIVLGLSGIFYDVLLICMNLGTFWDNVTSFTHIWSFAGICFIALGIYRLRKKHSFWSSLKKSFKLIVVSLLAFILGVSLYSLVFICNPALTDMNEQADYVILLGGGIDKDGNLPLSVMNRVKKAAEYLEKHPEVSCVVTGGTLKWLPYSEAPELKNQLVKAGIEENRILVEDKALDTIQNFEKSIKLISNNSGISVAELLDKKYVIVSNGFHLRRAERLAKRMGFTNVSGLSAKCPAYVCLHNYVREIGAYVKLNMRILLTGEPDLLS